MDNPGNTQMGAPAYFIYRDTSAVCDAGAAAPLAFFPAKDSDELFDALRSKYAHIKSHADRVREATIEFFMEEQASLTVSSAEMPALFEAAADLSPWQQSWPSESTTTLSSPETMSLATPSFYDYSTSTSQQTPQVRHSSAGLSSSVASPRALENMTSVFSLSTSEQPKQRIRRKMTEAEKVEYRRRRIVKACEKCKARKRKCIHNEPEVDKPTRKVAKSQSSSKKSINNSAAVVQPQVHEIDFDFESFINDVDIKAPSNDFGDFTLMYDDLSPKLSFDTPLDFTQTHTSFENENLNSGQQQPLSWDNQHLQYDFWPSQTSSVNSTSSSGSLPLQHDSSRVIQPEWLQDVALSPDSTGLNKTWLESEVNNATNLASRALQGRVAPHSWGGSGPRPSDSTSALNAALGGLDGVNHNFALSRSSSGSSQESRLLSHDASTSLLVTNATPIQGAVIATGRREEKIVNDARLHSAVVHNSDDAVSANGTNGTMADVATSHLGPSRPTSDRPTAHASAKFSARNGNSHGGLTVNGKSKHATASNGSSRNGTSSLPSSGARTQLATTSALSARPSVFDATPLLTMHRALATEHYVQLLTMKRRASTQPLLQTKPTPQGPTTAQQFVQANGGAYPWLDTPHIYNVAALEAPVKLELSAFASTKENGRRTERAAMHHVFTESDTKRYRDHHGRPSARTGFLADAAAWVLVAVAVFVLCAVLGRLASMRVAVEPTMLLLALVAPFGRTETKLDLVRAGDKLAELHSTAQRRMGSVTKMVGSLCNRIAWLRV